MARHWSVAGPLVTRPRWPALHFNRDDSLVVLKSSSCYPPAANSSFVAKALVYVRAVIPAQSPCGRDATPFQGLSAAP